MTMKQMDEGYRSQKFSPPNTRMVIVELASRDKVEIISRSYRITPNNLLSDIGGGLGLFLGFSIFTALSTIYDFALACPLFTYSNREN